MRISKRCYTFVMKRNSIRIKWRKYKSFFLLILTLPSGLFNCCSIFITKLLKNKIASDLRLCVFVCRCELHHSASSTVNRKVLRTLFVSDTCTTKLLPNWVYDLHFVFDFFGARNSKFQNDNKNVRCNTGMWATNTTNNSPKKSRPNLLC